MKTKNIKPTMAIWSDYTAQAVGLHPRYSPFFVREVKRGNWCPICDPTRNSGVPLPDIDLDEPKETT